MPIAPANIPRLQKAALGKIAEGIQRYEQGKAVRRITARGNLARWLMTEYGHVAGMTYAQANSVAARAIRTFQAAERANEAMGATLPLSQIPVEPLLQEGTGRFTYRVLVRRSDQSGQTVTYQVSLSSDVQLSATSVQQTVQEHMGEDYQGRGRTQDAIDRLGAGQTVETTIVSASRSR